MTNYIFAIADDHSVVRHGVSLLLKTEYPNCNVNQFSTFNDVIKFLTIEKINLLILDINFPDGNSLNIIPTIKKIQPELKILIFSAYDEEIYAVRYLSAGANGYLNKLCDESEIILAVDSVINNGRYVSQKINNKIMDTYIFKKPTNPLQQLSNREIEIAKLLVDGLGNNDISESLNIKNTTTSTYKNRIFQKLSINSVSELIQIFNLYFNNNSEE